MPILGRTKKEVLSEFRRTELLTAARTVFARKGFHDARVDEIAELAEVAKGTVYLYYKSKRELYLEALRFGIESLNEELRARLPGTEPAEDKLRLLTRTKLDFFEKNGDFFRIYYSELGRLPVHPSGLDLVRDLYAAQAAIWAELLREGVRRGELRDLDIERTSFAVADLTRGVITHRLLGISSARSRHAIDAGIDSAAGDDVDDGVDDDVEFVVDLIWKGIRR